MWYFIIRNTSSWPTHYTSCLEASLRLSFGARTAMDNEPLIPVYTWNKCPHVEVMLEEITVPILHVFKTDAAGVRHIFRGDVINMDEWTKCDICTEPAK